LSGRVLHDLKGRDDCFPVVAETNTSVPKRSTTPERLAGVTTLAADEQSSVAMAALAVPPAVAAAASASKAVDVVYLWAQSATPVLLFTAV